MGTKSQSFSLVLVALFIISLVVVPPETVKAQSNNNDISAPAIEWQQVYGSYVYTPSNLIQTSDGGYVFMDLGWIHYSVKPATVFKVDSSGSIQWNKTIDSFVAVEIIQTSDEGYEITGSWSTFGFFQITAALIKMGSQGNIQWYKNYSNVDSLPNLDVSKKLTLQTSDGGFVNWNFRSQRGNITKTDANNNTQWVKTLVYPYDGPQNYPTGTSLLDIISVIETADGAIAAIGVGNEVLGNHFTGNIYLVKTEPFLPLPSPTQLPTPLPTNSPTPSQLPANDFYLIAPIIIFAVIVVVSVLLYRRHRKPISQNKPNV